jgi:hypothetical protein
MRKIGARRGEHLPTRSGDILSQTISETEAAGLIATAAPLTQHFLAPMPVRDE